MTELKPIYHQLDRLMGTVTEQDVNKFISRIKNLLKLVPLLKGQSK